MFIFSRRTSTLYKCKNNRELETIIQECILIAVRESIPTEAIIRAYMDECIEQDEEVIIENLDEVKDSSETPEKRKPQKNMNLLLQV